MFNIKTKTPFDWEDANGYCADCKQGHYRNHSLRFKIIKIGDSDLHSDIIYKFRENPDYVYSGYVNEKFIRLCIPALGVPDNYHWAISNSWDIEEIGLVKPIILICRKK